MADLEQLKSEARAAGEHLAAMRQAQRDAEAAERAALDANDPRDTSAKALAPVEAARARLASAKHHVEKATARDHSATMALGLELRRLAREEFDAMADRFGMRGWEKGNAEKLEELARLQSAARKLQRELLDDVERWNAPAKEMFATAERTGFVAEVPERASTGAIAEVMRNAYEITTPLEIEAVRGLYMDASRPEHRHTIAWGKKLLRKLIARATAHLAEGTEIEPDVYFGLLESALARCKPAKTRGGTVTSEWDRAGEFLFGTEEHFAVDLALAQVKADFYDRDKRGPIPDVRDRNGQLIDTRKIIVERRQAA